MDDTKADVHCKPLPYLTFSFCLGDDGSTVKTIAHWSGKAAIILLGPPGPVGGWLMINVLLSAACKVCLKGIIEQ